MLKAAYGYDVQPENDFYVNLAYIAMDPLSHAVHENYIVEFIPLLKHIPGTAQQRGVEPPTYVLLDRLVPGGGFQKDGKGWSKEIARSARYSV